MLDQSGIEWSKRGSMIKWNMSHEQARNTFDFGSTMDKVDGDYVYYMEEMRFSINLKSRTLTIKGVIMKKNLETGIVKGYDLLNE